MNDDSVPNSIPNSKTDSTPHNNKRKLMQWVLFIAAMVLAGIGVIMYFKTGDEKVLIAFTAPLLALIGALYATQAG